jgi:PEP-CTERM/exosortase A-associated glycosyltransferase
MSESLPNIVGYTIRAKYLLEAQASSGHDVFVLTSPNQGGDAVDERIGAVEYFRSHYSSSERRLVALGAKQFGFQRSVKRRLTDLVAGGGFDLIHAHTPFTVALPALKVARRHGLPFVYEKRNLWEESARARGKWAGRWPFYQASRMIDTYITRSADAVCVITDALRNSTIHMGVDPARIVVVKNGVDVWKFQPEQPPKELRDRCLNGGSIVFGFIGSFFKFEGLPFLIRTFARCVKRYSGMRLVLIGDGEDMEAIRRIVSEEKIENRVWIPGKVPHEHVRDYYAAIDVFVYPRSLSALTELISPLKPLEAMAMERCVVGSDVGGIRDLMKDGETGILYRAGDMDDLASKLSAIAEGKLGHNQIGCRAKEYVERNHQWTVVARSYEDAYRKAIANQEE